MAPQNPQFDTLPTPSSPSLGRSFFWLALSGFIAIANSVLVWVFIARYLPIEDVGRLTIVMGLYGLFVCTCSLGLMPFFISEIGRLHKATAPDEGVVHFVSAAAIFVLGSGVASVILMSLSGFWASGSATVRLSVAILAFAMLPTGLITVAESVLVAEGRTRLIALVTTIENLMRTAIPIYLVVTGYGIVPISVSFLGVRLAALCVYALIARHHLSKLSLRIRELRTIARVAPTFAGTIILASILWQAGAIFLGHFSTEVETAKYGAASRFLLPVGILMSSYASVIQPALVNAGAYDLGRRIMKFMSYPLLISAAVAIASPSLSGQILNLLFGGGYAESAEVLDLLALSTVPFCIVMVGSRGLVAMRRQHIDLAANASGVAAFFLFGSALIPQYGAAGAALTLLVAFSLMAVIEIAYLIWGWEHSPGDERPAELVSE